MMTSTFKKTAVAAAVATIFNAGAAPEAEAVVMNFSWTGAFTFLNQSGSPLRNTPSDYAAGYYANGDSNVSSFGAPYLPGNVGPNATPSSTYPGAYQTAYGWNGNRTPIRGTLAFDTSTGAATGTVNPFFFFGDTPGSGAGTHTTQFLGVSFATVDTVGTMVGTMLLSWNGAGHSISVVLDSTGFFDAITAGWLPGCTLSGNTLSGPGCGSVTVGSVLPATDGVNFGSAKTPLFLPLGPTPLATKTLNALGCEGLPLSLQVNPYTINPISSNISTCDLTQDDGIGGSPLVSPAFAAGEQMNFDIGSGNSITLVSIASAPVPIPAAVWLFGSGLLGLAGIARRRKKE